VQAVGPEVGASPSPSRAGVPQRVFISYRRSDSVSAAGRLDDALKQIFGQARVFRDTKDIRPGMNFVSTIEQGLRDCAAVLAVIGPNWLARLQNYGSRPSDGPVDFLRFEIKSALAQGVQLIPILVDGATMPIAQDLPDELKPLVLLQGLELRDKDWEHDLEQLAEVLRPILDPPRVETPPPVPTNRRVDVATALGVAIVVLTAVVHAGLSRGPLTGIGAVAPDFVGSLLRNQGRETGIGVLVVGALLFMLRALAKQYSDALAGRFGDWLRNGRVFGVVTGCVIALPLLLMADRLLLAAALATLAASYFAARGLAPRFFASPMRAGLAGAGALTVLAGAWGADILTDRERQSSFDVAFVLPPEGGSDLEAGLQIFDDVTKALQIALKDADNVEVIPTQLTKDDFHRYVISDGPTLLGMKGRKGYPRVFIRVAYSNDAATGVKRIGVKPYLRPAGRTQTIRLFERWNKLPMAGKAASNVVALKAGFELIAFLASEGVLRLNPAQAKQVWLNLFDEYVDALTFMRGDCNVADDRVAGLRALRATLNESELRRVLFETCVANTSPPAGTPGADASAKALATATAPYADLMPP
jgi:TIR domain